MSVSGELLCSFELLKPLDSSALKSHIKKGRNKRQSMLNSPVSPPTKLVVSAVPNECVPACDGICTELLGRLWSPNWSGMSFTSVCLHLMVITSSRA